MRTKGSKNGGPGLAKAMGSAGFVRRDDAARLLQVTPQTISNWASDPATVRSRSAMGVTFVHWGDCVRHYGVDNALLIKAITPEAAAKMRKGKEVANVG